MSIKIRIIPAALAALLLAGCGDPQQAAQNRIQSVHEALTNASKDLDPLDRLATYDKLLDQVKAVGANYGKTPTGRAIAAGDTVDGVSIAGMQARRDALAARAKCYADPTVACLQPFGSGAAQRQSAQPQNALAQSAALICAVGFAAADQSLASFKINQPVYTKQLVQLALAAAACHKPDAVKAAIGAYMATVPAGDERTGSLLSILATPDLQPAWPLVSTELENGLKSGAIAGQNAGSAALALAVAYAKSSDIKDALAKYAYFTDTLHDRASDDTIEKLAVAVMLAGDADTAVKIADGSSVPSDKGTFLVRNAAKALGQRMGLLAGLGYPYEVVQSVNDGGPHFGTIRDYLKAVDGQDKARDAKAADTIEGQVDKLAASSTRADLGEAWGLDSDYAIVALARYKLGDPGKAAATSKKATDLQTRLLGQEQASGYTVLLHLAQGDAATAARLAKAANANLGYPALILTSVAATTGDATKTLSVRGELGDLIPDSAAFSAMVAGLTQAGKPDEVDKLIAAWPGDPAAKPTFYEPMLDQMIADGNVDGARSFMARHSPISGDLEQYRFDRRLLASKKIAGNRSVAEPIIREMFKIGQGMDKGNGLSYAGGSDHYTAQNAATMAFENGYTDLGIELYQAAENRDQRPLVAAFPDNMKKADMPKLLMLAQDNASGDALGYVVDHAITYLQRKAAH